MGFAYKAKIVDVSDKGNVRMLISGRLSFAQSLLSAQEFMGRTVYNCDILLERESLTTEVKSVMKEALNAAIKGGIEHKWNGRKPANLDTPYRNGDDRHDDKPDIYEAYRGCYFLSPKRQVTQGPPYVWDQHGNRIEQTGDKLDGGDWCAFDITLYPYARGKNKGIAVSLNSVRLIKTGDRFSGGPSAESSLAEFDNLFGEELAEASTDEGLDDLYGQGSFDDDIPPF